MAGRHAGQARRRDGQARRRRGGPGRGGRALLSPLRAFACPYAGQAHTESNNEAARMNPIERAIRKVDATQRRFTPTAFVFGVMKKYGDDNGGVLVSNLAYSSFVSLFPLLLVPVTVLGLIASVDERFKTDVLNAVAGQVPLIGSQLTGNVHQLKRSSTIGLIVGLVGLIWGATGLAQSGLVTMEQGWDLPRPSRPGSAHT